MRAFLFAAAAVLALTAPAAAQTPAAKPVSYAALDALPDWRGIWLPASGPRTPADPPPLSAEYQARYDAHRAASAAGRDKGVTPRSNCLPPGMPRVMQQPYNIEFLFTPGRVTIIQEAYMQVRRVFTDGRPLPEDPDPAFNGHSVGRWDGATLIVETTGVRDDTWLSIIGVSHSDQLKITERISLDSADPDRLVIETTYEDPKALTRPWKQRSAFTRNREWEQIEFICAENDRNPVGEDGRTGFELRE
jgi:hypothetical protein